MPAVNIQRRFRDTVDAIVPVWLRNRPGFDVGYRTLWGGLAILDGLFDILLAGQRGARPGHGMDEPGLAVTSALPLVGASRGIIRGEDDTEEEFAEKLRAWLDEHRNMASQEVLAHVIHGYVSGHPRVRVIQQGSPARGLPIWITVEQDGTVTTTEASWDWDSISNPDRNNPDEPHWSDIWIVVYPAYAHRPNVYGDGTKWGGDRWGIGHLVNRQAFDALLGQLGYWKGAHTRIRAILWAQQDGDYNPDGSGLQPDGTWGRWSMLDGSGNSVPSGRDRTYTRYWEPR